MDVARDAVQHNCGPRGIDRQVEPAADAAGGVVFFGGLHILQELLRPRQEPLEPTIGIVKFHTGPASFRRDRATIR